MATQVMNDRREADLVGTWLARIGSVAVMVGAAFGFAYAVDRGFIGPTGRVAVGLVAAAAFVAWGEHSRVRGWARLAQALVAGGLVLATLSIWASAQLYDLIRPEAALGALVVVTALTVVQALRYDALALAVLAAIGGYMAPALAGAYHVPEAMLMTYVIVLSAGLLVVAFAKRWVSFQYVTLFGAAILFAVNAYDADPSRALGFATALAAVFAAAPMVRAALTGVDSNEEELAYSVLVTGGLFGAAMALMPEARAAWAAGIGVASLGLAALSLQIGDRRRAPVHLGAGLVLLVVAVPLAVEGPWLVTLWAAQGAAMVALAERERSGILSGSGLTLIVASITVWLSVLGEDGYAPDRLLASAESFAFASQIGALVVAAVAFRRPARALWERQIAPILVGAATFLAFGWLSVEAVSTVVRASLEPLAQERAIAFALSLTWGLFAAGLLTTGVLARVRGARIAGLALFTIVLHKLAIYDVWELPTAYRFVAFTGLGIVLLLMSVLYHRLRELLGPDPEDQAVEHVS